MFVEKSGFEENRAEKQDDSDAQRVEHDIAGGGVAAGDIALVDFIKNADDQSNGSRNEKTKLQSNRTSGLRSRGIATQLNPSDFESPRDGHD